MLINCKGNAAAKHEQTGTVLCPAMLANALKRNASNSGLNILSWIAETQEVWFAGVLVILRMDLVFLQAKMNECQFQYSAGEWWKSDSFPPKGDFLKNNN